jgi:hypothetical protein
MAATQVGYNLKHNALEHARSNLANAREFSKISEHHHSKNMLDNGFDARKSGAKASVL